MNDNTLLYSQIRPEHVQNGRVSSLAFRPMPKDEQKLSVYDGDKLSPEEAYLHFTEELKGSSVGVLAVNVRECKDEELPVEEDYDTHTRTIFSLISRTSREIKSERQPSI